MAQKQVTYFQGKYYQGDLSDANAAAILNLVNNVDVVADIKHEIANLPYVERERIIDKYTKEEQASGFVKEGHFPRDKTMHIGTLRDEQTVGVTFMYLNGSCLLGDEVGLGKTVQVAGFMNIVRKQYARKGKHFSLLFLSEKTSVAQIRSKLVQFTGEYVGLLPSGEQDVIAEFARHRENGSDYSVVATHAAVNSNVFMESITKHPFDVLVIDETAVLRNKQTSFYLNARALGSLFKYRIALNATPVEMSPIDIYNQLDFVDPTLLPSKGEFEATFCKKERTTTYGYQITGYKNEDIFRTAISLRYLARTRADLGASYKDNEYKIVVAPLSPEQKKLMKKTSLHQLCADYPTGVLRRVPYNENTCGKVKILVDLLKECAQRAEQANAEMERKRALAGNAHTDDDVMQNGRALVYVKYKDCQADLAKILEAHGYRVAIINGQVAGKKRGAIIEEANQGLYDVILTNIYRAYDLPSFTNCIFYTVDPNPQNMIQFEGRITRDIDVIGKRIYMIISEGVEMEVLRKLQERIATSRAFTTSGRSLISDAVLNKDNIDFRGSDDNSDGTITLSSEDMFALFFGGADNAPQ